MRRRYSKSKRSVAFTLVELLIALTIASILTLIALPTLKDSMRQNSLSRAASLVKGAFINARAQAIQTGRPFGVVLERRRNRIGDGTANNLDFTAANYATRLYYVQSPIEYRGDTVDAKCYPVFNTNPGSNANYPTSQFPQIPRLFFPQSAAGILYASAVNNTAALNLIRVGTRFSLDGSGYVFEITGLTQVTTYSSSVVTPAFTISEPGTLVDFNVVGFSPESSQRPAELWNINPAAYLSTFQQLKFPMELEPFAPIEFRFRTSPIPAPLAPVALMGKTVVDLSISGTATEPMKYGAQSIVDYDQTQGIPSLAADALLHNVAVMFAPDGSVEGVYSDQRTPLYPPGSDPIAGFTIIRDTPASTISFNVGYVDGILDNIDDGARYTGDITGTVYRTGANDPAHLRPLPPATLDETNLKKTPNFANADCAWISIQPQSGTISLDSVATQPLLGHLQTYYSDLVSGSQSARDVMAIRVRQSRRLGTAGTVQ
ncbi:Tfp pilus assembly protein FimT/FimU [Rhodopirellula sp. MGV]|uniref:pilus assembly FimT family protein n=1 Tax=Rhodopirellula sp. MGV TaxID=2023130 RepID=UPI000B95CBE7|nr:prepilin-type N-terminal cleavage/methylation domain-containing protein [Rhodopirellula sp. MGV]OYP32176.1 hypothetical protein CGZ80_20485 [Rhodopirellula sp. MGV]PNY35184.1 prepilin-type N-terminal cleavage/methylation domain-containing protein [Rhodopirellula baltica]